DAHDEFQSLGSLFYEPLWVFTRREFSLGGVEDLRGRRVAVGAEGSGTLPLALKVLEASGLAGQLTTVQIGGDEAAAALRDGDVDAAFFVSSPQGAAMKALIEDPGLTFHGLRRERAYQTAFPNLATLTIGEGQLN